MRFNAEQKRLILEAHKHHERRIDALVAMNERITKLDKAPFLELAYSEWLAEIALLERAGDPASAVLGLQSIGITILCADLRSLGMFQVWMDGPSGCHSRTRAQTPDRPRRSSLVRWIAQIVPGKDPANSARSFRARPVFHCAYHAAFRCNSLWIGQRIGVPARAPRAANPR